MKDLPWGAMFGLLFMTMGPIRAVAVFSKVGDRDDTPGARALALRASALAAAAFILTVLIGNAVLTNWGVRFSTLIAAGGVVLVALSLQTLLFPTAPVPAQPQDPKTVAAVAVAFSGLFPPVAVSIPLIFSAPFPGWETHLGILAMGLGLVAVNLLLMLRAKRIIGAVGPVPLQLFGAVSGILQMALGLQFIANAFALR